MTILKPNAGARIVFHGYDEQDYVLLYLFRRPEGAYVVLDLLDGELVDIGRFNEGTEPGSFQYYTDCLIE